MGVILQQSIKGTIVTYLGTFLGFLTTFFVLTRFLSPAEVGLSRVLIDTATLLISLGQLGASTSIIRFFPYFKDESTQHHGFFGYTVIIPLIGFLVFGLLYIILKQPVSTLFDDKSPLFVQYYYFVLPLAFAMLYQIIFETNLNVLMHVVFPRFVREILVRLCMLSTYLLYAFNHISLTGFVVAICTTYGIAALANILYLLYKQRTESGNADMRSTWVPQVSFLTPELKRRFRVYTLFLITAALAGILAPMLSSYYVTSQMGLAYTGIFTIATYMASMVAMPYRTLGAITNPHIAQAVKDNNSNELTMLSRKVALNQYLVGAFVFLAIWVNIDLIYAILPNGGQYAEGRYALHFLLWGQLITSALMVSNNVLNYSSYFYISLLFTVALAVFTLFFNALLLPRWGMAGAAAASTLAYIVYYAIQLLTIRIKMNVRIITPNLLKITLLMLAVIGVDGLLNHFIIPEQSDVFVLFLVAIVKNSVLLALPAYYCYKTEMSKDMNALINSIIAKAEKFVK